MSVRQTIMLIALSTGQALACVPCATFDSQAATCTAALNATGQLVPSIQTCKTGFVPNATGDSCICKLTTQQRVNSTTCQACPTSYTCNGGPSAICAGSQIDGACSRVFNTSTRLGKCLVHQIRHRCEAQGMNTKLMRILVSQSHHGEERLTAVLRSTTQSSAP